MGRGCIEPTSRVYTQVPGCVKKKSYYYIIYIYIIYYIIYIIPVNNILQNIMYIRIYKLLLYIIYYIIIYEGQDYKTRPLLLACHQLVMEKTAKEWPPCHFHKREKKGIPTQNWGQRVAPTTARSWSGRLTTFREGYTRYPGHI